MNRGKLAAGVIIGCCLVISLTACGPRQSKALVGMSVDGAGKPVFVLQDCEGVIQEIEVYDSAVAPTNATAGETPVVEYANSDPQKAVVTIPLAGGSGWQPVDSVPQLRPAGQYSVQIWGENHGWAARGTRFTLADLKGLKPGLVRYRPATATPSAGGSPVKRTFSADGHEWNIVTSLEDFISGDCP